MFDEDCCDIIIWWWWWSPKHSSLSFWSRIDDIVPYWTCLGELMLSFGYIHETCWVTQWVTFLKLLPFRCCWWANDQCRWLHFSAALKRSLIAYWWAVPWTPVSQRNLDVDFGQIDERFVFWPVHLAFILSKLQKLLKVVPWQRGRSWVRFPGQGLSVQALHVLHVPAWVLS